MKEIELRFVLLSIFFFFNLMGFSQQKVIDRSYFCKEKNRGFFFNKSNGTYFTFHYDNFSNKYCQDTLSEGKWSQDGDFVLFKANENIVNNKRKIKVREYQSQNTDSTYIHILNNTPNSLTTNPLSQNQGDFFKALPHYKYEFFFEGQSFPNHDYCISFEKNIRRPKDKNLKGFYVIVTPNNLNWNENNIKNPYIITDFYSITNSSNNIFDIVIDQLYSSYFTTENIDNNYARIKDRYILYKDMKYEPVNIEINTIK